MSGSVEVVFISNSASPHVQPWREVCAGIGLSISEISVNDSLSRRKSLFRVLAEIRKAGASGAVLHAHGGGLAGMLALLSLRPYVLTTYGSEYLQTSSRFRSFLVGIVARRALRISTSSPNLADVLQDRFGIARSRICTFSLGTDPKEISDARDDRESARTQMQIDNDIIVFLSARRALPLYHTGEILEGFRAVADDLPVRSVLVLVRGHLADEDPSFFDSVVAAAATDDRVIVIDRPLLPPQFLSLMAAADVVISVPSSDQLSAVLIEARLLDRTVISTRLDAYRPLFDDPGFVWIDQEVSASTISSAILLAVSAPTTKAPTWIVESRSDAQKRLRGFYGI